jgi:hypothetical protein
MYYEKEIGGFTIGLMLVFELQWRLAIQGIFMIWVLLNKLQQLWWLSGFSLIHWQNLSMSIAINLQLMPYECCFVINGFCSWYMLQLEFH